MNLSLFNVYYPAVFVQNTLRDLKNAKRQAAMPTRPRASQANQRKEEEEEQEEEEMKVSNSISSSFLLLHLYRQV